MNIKRILCLALAMLLTLGACALAEEAPATGEELLTEAAEVISESAEEVAEEAAEAAEAAAEEAVESAEAVVEEAVEAVEAAEVEEAKEAVEEAVEAVEAEEAATQEEASDEAQPEEAAAEDGDLQAQLDEANARIEALEAEVALYRPYYENQIVAEYGEDGIIWLEDAQAEFDEASAMYAQYGIPVENYAAEIKQSIVENMVRQAVLDAKADELGLSDLPEDVVADLTAQAADDLETYITYYGSYFAQEGASDEENREATIQGLAANGIDVETLVKDRISNYISEQLYNAVTADVTVSDEEIEAEYQAMVAEDEENYADDDAAYNAARSDEGVIAWNPEGYRTVKHVLVKFDDDQAKQYSELQSALTSLNDELAALDNPEEAEEDAESDDAESDDAEVAAPRTREEIQSDIGEIGASIEALYAQLMPKAQEVVDAFNDGTDIDTLIEKYGEDPGMTQEPAKSQGYAVAENSTYWDPAFTEGAMSIAEVGQISEPVRGQYGVHIIYYLSDITPGAVPFDDIADAVAESALEEKIAKTYDEQVDAWVEAAQPVYHLDRF